MPITRDLRTKPVLFLLDHPVVKEEDSGNAYSEYCSTTLKQALLGAAASFNKNNDKFHLGVNEVCYTYLSSSRPVTGDSDWKTSIVNKKNLPAGETYHQCEWLKDVWVSPKVWKSIQETIEQIKQYSLSLSSALVNGVSCSSLHSLLTRRSSLQL